MPAEVYPQIKAMLEVKVEHVENVEAKVVEIEFVLETVLNKTGVAKNSTRRKGFKEVVVKWVRASYPFVTTFLTVANEGAAVTALS